MVALWREARRNKQLPDGKGSSAPGIVGYKKITLNPENSSVRPEQPGMRLDLGIGQGYAADQALAILTARGIPKPSWMRETLPWAGAA